MKNFLYVIALSLIITACQRNPSDFSRLTETPIRVDSSFVPPVIQLKYYGNGAYFFGFADTGKYFFSADTLGNQFKVNILIHEKDVFFDLIDSSRFTYYYDTSYRLTSIERDDFNGAKHSLRLFYSGEHLERFEEWSGNTKYKTYDISHEATAGGSKLSIAPYLRGGDSISHSVFFNTQGKVTQVQQRLRRGTSELWNFDFAITYAGNDVVQREGYERFQNFTTPRTDSLWTTFVYDREAGESPVLANYMEKLYGKEFYAILNYFDLLQFQSTPSGLLSLLVLPGQNKSSETGYQYIALVYTNGAVSHLQTSSFTTENTFDGQHRLTKSKVNSTPPYYYIWELIYR